MATPVVTLTPDKSAAYAPGEAITVSWTVTDTDNSTERLVLEGTDSQNNTVTVELDINRQDTFTATRVYWQRTNANFAVNNGTRTATSVVPSV